MGFVRDVADTSGPRHCGKYCQNHPFRAGRRSAYETLQSLIPTSVLVSRHEYVQPQGPYTGGWRIVNEGQASWRSSP